MPPVSLLLEDMITAEAELGATIGRRIRQDVGPIKNHYVNPHGATPHIIVMVEGGENHHYNLLKDDRGREANQASAKGVSTEAIALYSLLTDDLRFKLAALNPTLARKFESLPAVPDRDASRELKWCGYVNTPEMLASRVKELRGGDDWIDGLLPTRSLGVIVGDSGEGKSPLIYQQAFCVATGIPFLGRRTRQGRVLVVDLENGQGQVLAMLGQFASHFKVPLPGDLRLLNANDVPPEWGSPGHTLFDLINDLKPDIVFIDSLGSAFPEIESTNEIANKKFKQLREVISTSGTSILLVTHTRKVSNDPKREPVSLQGGDVRRWFHETRGARSIINGSDVRLGVEGHSHADLLLRGFRRVDGELPALLLKRVRDEDGKPIAYEQLTGSGLLFNEDQEATFGKLPQTFSFTDAKHVYEKKDQATLDFLKKCVGLGILEQPRHRGPYIKR